MAENKRQEKELEKGAMRGETVESMEERAEELKKRAEELRKREAELEALEALIEERAREREAWEQKRMEEQIKLRVKAQAAERATGGAGDAMRPVKLRLAMDKTRKDALFVGFNNRTYQIPRGRDVVVPYCVAKHIQETTEQDEQTAMLISMYEEQFDKRRDALV